jgi:hypothetical protein
MFGPIQTQRANAFVQIGPLHTERPRGPGDVPTGFFERAQDMIALGRFAGFFQIRSRREILGQPDFDRRRFGRQMVALGEYGHAFHNIAQLARVSGPGIRFEDWIRFVGNPLGVKVVAHAKIVEKIFGQWRYVLRPLAQ